MENPSPTILSSESSPPAAYDELFLFLHIPKTGGNTVRTVLSCVFGDDGWADIFLPSRAEIDLAERARIERGAVKDRVAVPGTRGIGINGTFGIRGAVDGKARYFTTIREPRARLISYWNFAYETRGSKARWSLYERHRLDLAEILECAVDPGLQNDQVRVLSGTASGPLGRRDLAAAKENMLRSFDCVILTEKLDTDLPRYLERAWRPHWEMPRLNTGQLDEPYGLDRLAMDLLLEHNQLDLELYEWFVSSAADHFADRRLEYGEVAGPPLRRSS